jgi:hypothetical protein
MRIPDQLLKCLGFVSRDQEVLDYKGSAFVVSVPYDEHSGCLHLVTAKHVAVKLQNGEAAIAMNGKDGLPLWMKNGNQTPWFFHPTDPTVDVAVLPMASLRLREYDYQDISINLFATQERIAEYGIGLGDEIINIGLFTPFVGASRFTPIVRTGTIAMMPEGRLPHPVYGSVEAYLAEGRSIGGLSGSPVFVRDTLHMPVMTKDGVPAQMSALGTFHLLGLMLGHWDAPPDFSEPGGRSINMGISIVVPAYKILEVLFSDELIALRQEAFNRGFPPE